MILAGPWLSLLAGGFLAGVTIALLGWRALARRQPVVLATRWLLPSALLLIAIEPIAIVLRKSGDPSAISESDRTGMVLVLVVTAIAVGIVAQRRIFSGYSIFGVDLHTARRALVASLRGLELAYEVRDRRYRLRESGAEIEIAQGTPRGTVRLHVRRRRDDALLRRLVDAIEVCLRSEQVSLAPGKCVKWMVTGLALALACGAGAVLLWKLGE